jgi:GTP pyrophosphokinase
LENNDFISSLKIDIFSDRIFVFTPKWDSINLPAGSTAIDFAYNLHSDLGDHISVAKANGKVYPLDKELHNWDVIDIIIDKNRRPNPFWLSFVKTSKAKSRIRNFLKKEDKDSHRERGREVMNKFLEKSWLWTLDKDLSLLKIIDWTAYKLEERLALLEQVWNFSITPSSLIRRILKTHKWEDLVKKRTISKEKYEEKKLKDEKTKEKRVIVWGDKDIKYKLASCCKRRIPKAIVGHINSKWIINIHNVNCKILKDVNKDRLLPAYIEWEKLDSIFVKLWFEVSDSLWVLNWITQVLFNMKINIEEITQKKSVSWNKEIILLVEILDWDYLLVDRLVDRIALKLWDNLINKNILEIKA